jgi:hypothetical protein
MANESTTTSLAGLVDDIQGESLMILQDNAGLQELVRSVDTMGTPGKTYDFPIYGAVTSADVTQVAEGTDHTTNKQITNAATAATVEEHVIMAVATKLAVESSRDDVIQEISVLFASAMLAKLEDDIVGLASGFSQTVCGAAVSMTVDHWYDAIRQIKAASGNLNELAAALSPKSYYGAKGLRSLLINTTSVNSGSVAQKWVEMGMVDTQFGMPALISNEIAEDVGSSDVAANMIWTRGAIGLHTKNLMDVEEEPNASLRGKEIVATGRWKQIELVDAWGVYFACNTD